MSVVFTALDRESPVFRKFQSLFSERLFEHRENNDNRTLDATATAVLRGRIAELKQLMDQVKPDPEPPAEG